MLAGSTRFLSVPQLSESLAGRAEILDLWPLSQGELAGVRETFLDTLLTDPDQLARRRFEQIDRRVLFDRLVRGGYPELVDASPAQAARWYRNYVRTVVERDIIEASAITQADELPMLLRLLAANTSGEMVTARLAGDARMSADTVSRYVGLLELVGFVVRIRAWTPSLTSREKRHPKVVITDTGLACGLLGRNAEGLGMATSPLTGPLLESFVTMELVKQRGWSGAADDSSLAGPQRRRGRSDRRGRQRNHRRRRGEGSIDRVAGRREAPPRSARQARRPVHRRCGALPRRPGGSARRANLGPPRPDALGGLILT